MKDCATTEEIDPAWVEAWCSSEEDTRIVQALLDTPEEIFDLDELHVFELLSK